MGEVHLALDTRLDRKVAIKVCREQFSGRFEREARAISVLNHPKICTLYDVGPKYLVSSWKARLYAIRSPNARFPPNALWILRNRYSRAAARRIVRESSIAI
jgi:serine/threonine protein kinase